MKFNLSKFITGNIIGVVLVVLYFVTINVSYACTQYFNQHKQNNSCSQWGNNNGWGKNSHNNMGNSCQTGPTPQPQTTPVPTSVPNVTPTPTTPGTTVTPTPAPSNNNGGGNSPVIYGPGSSTKAPGAATCNVPFAAPILQGYSLNAAQGTETYSWWTSTANGISKQSVEYGYQVGSPIYGADNLPTNQTSLVIKGLNLNQISWARVGAWQNGCVEWSNWFN